MQLTSITTILALATSALALNDGETVRGRATLFYQDCSGSVQPGSCGAIHSDEDLLVAAPMLYGHNVFCGKTVTIKNIGGGVNNFGEGTIITATVVDTCPECGPEHLDLSVGAFKALTGGQIDPPGTINIEWTLS